MASAVGEPQDQFGLADLRLNDFLAREGSQCRPWVISRLPGGLQTQALGDGAHGMFVHPLGDLAFESTKGGSLGPVAQEPSESPDADGTALVVQWDAAAQTPPPGTGDSDSINKDQPVPDRAGPLVRLAVPCALRIQVLCTPGMLQPEVLAEGQCVVRRGTDGPEAKVFMAAWTKERSG